MTQAQHPSVPRGNGVTRVTQAIVTVLRVILVIGIVALFLGGALVLARWSAFADELGASEGFMPMLMVLLLIGGVIILFWLFDAVLSRLSKILKTVAAGNPFIHDNARRLRSIGWIMVSIQAWAFAMFAVVSLTKEHLPKMAINADYEPSGLLSILLAFVLAHVFEQGVAMREENEGTI